MLDFFGRVVPPAEAPADGGRRLAAHAATAGGQSGLAGHRHLWDRSPGPRRGPGLPGCTGTLHEAQPSEGLAVTLALRRLPAGQREAIVLTFCLDLSPELAAAMRVSLATL